MSHDRTARLRALLTFYIEAGVDSVLEEAPVDRFTAADENDGRGVPGAARAHPPGTQPQDPHAYPHEPRTHESATHASPHRAVPRAATPHPRDGFSRGAPPRSPPPATLPPDVAIMAAREAAAQAASLDDLRSLLERFEGCALRFTARRLVFADGNPDARVMFVGEAPGREEDQAGRPFVGRSGHMLDLMLGAIGLDRTKVYIANVVPWRPPGNRTPTPQEAQICLPFLKRQIELADPDILVSLGGPSAAALLGMTDGIRRFRGRWRTYHTGRREIRALATFHPSYLLRSPLEKRSAWRDFMAIRTALAQ